MSYPKLVRYTLISVGLLAALWTIPALAHEGHTHEPSAGVMERLDSLLVAATVAFAVAGAFWLSNRTSA